MNGRRDREQTTRGTESPAPLDPSRSQLSPSLCYGLRSTVDTTFCVTIHRKLGAKRGKLDCYVCNHLPKRCRYGLYKETNRRTDRHPSLRSASLKLTIYRKVTHKQSSYSLVYTSVVARRHQSPRRSNGQSTGPSTPVPSKR